MNRTNEQKLHHRLYMRKWRKEKPEKMRAIWKRYRIRHHEVLALRRKSYQDKRPHAHYIWNKTWRQKHYEKYCIQRTRRRLRREQRGFVPIAKNIFDVPVDWHHIAPNQPYVMALPSEIHQAVFGKNHYVFNASVIHRLYGLGEWR